MAFATTPLETPEKVEVTAVSTTTATVSGVLAPKAAGAGEAGSYFFLYGVAAPGECGAERLVSEGPGGVAVEELGIAAGLPKEKKEVHLTGLHPAAKYTVCLFERNSSESEQVESVPVAFETKTPIHLETPVDLQAKSIGATEAALSGVLNPGAERKAEPGTYEFVYRHSSLDACQGQGEQTTTLVKALGAKEEPAGPAKIEGLSPGTSYAFCVLVHNEAGEEALSPASTFTTPPLAPTIVAESESDSEVTATGAKVSATVTPGGPETPYRVTIEYGPNTEYGSTLTLPEHEAGFGVSEVHLEEQLNGLSPNTTYHFRFVVANATAPAGIPGPDESFTTQSTNTNFTLPDNRAYEMVTPVQKQGALFKDTGAIRAAASGDAIADIATLPTESGPEGDANERLSVLSTRTSSGWSSRTIAAPHLAAGPPVALEDNGEYLFFSSDLSGAVLQLQASGFEKLSPQATEQTPYLHTLFLDGNVSEACDAPYTTAASCYAPLVGRSDDTASPLEPFGELTAAGLCVSITCGPTVHAGTPDLSHLVLTSKVPLTATPAPTGAGRGTSSAQGQPDLYEYSAGRLQLLSILPRAQDPTEEGSPDLELAGREPLNGKSGADVAARHAISDNGNRVVLGEYLIGGGGSVFHSGLYLRDVGKGETIRLDQPASEPGTEASVEPEYVDANSEDTRIFFVDSAKLTADSGASYLLEGSGRADLTEDRPDLYECQIVEENEKDKCDLTDLTPKTNGESARVATVLGASEDGSYVYFAAGGGLGIAPLEPEPGGCGDEGLALREESPPTALCNVYVRHDGVTRFVAALSQQDSGDWENNGLLESPVSVSPNGAYLAFSSHRDLTGYDTNPAVPSDCGHVEGSHSQAHFVSEPCSEMYLYHAPVDLATEAGTLSCASCNPTGSRRAGGASVPGWPNHNNQGGSIEAFYQPRYLSDEGRLFFNSPDALVPLDVSKHSEVYEYEPVGTGTCTEGTSSGSELYVPSEHGCVSLISTGTAAEGSQFLEAAEGSGEGEHGEAGSQGGRDVFFLTTEKVLPQDVDSVPDVYDAHECTTASPCIAPPSALRPCETEASCKAPPTPQPTIYAAPATATFSGPGNVIPPPAVVPKTVTKKTTKCKKGDVKNKQGKCVKKPKKKKTKAKKSVRHERGRSSRSHD
jgi:hypothetical protein